LLLLLAVAVALSLAPQAGGAKPKMRWAYPVFDAISLSNGRARQRQQRHFWRVKIDTDGSTPAGLVPAPWAIALLSALKKMDR